jgi:hypothetical protein
MKPAKSKFQIVTAVAVVFLFVLSVGCNGFFVDPTLTTITITPITPSVPVAQTVQMTATGTYDDGSVKNITGSVSWSLSPAGFATITQSGSLKGVAQGSTTSPRVPQVLPRANRSTTPPWPLWPMVRPRTSARPRPGAWSRAAPTSSHRASRCRRVCPLS